MSDIELFLAAKDGRYEEAAACIARADPTWTLQGRSALHWTARDGHVRVAELLLDHGWDLEARTSAGQRPLHEAARCGRVEVMQLLAARGADINSQDNGRWTPLHWAAREGHPAAVKLLLSLGAGTTIKNKNGKTPEMVAKVVKSTGGKRPINMSVTKTHSKECKVEIYQKQHCFQFDR